MAILHNIANLETWRGDYASLAASLAELEKLSSVTSDSVRQMLLRLIWNRIIEREYDMLYADPDKWPATLTAVHSDHAYGDYRIIIMPIASDSPLTRIAEIINSLPDISGKKYHAVILVGELPIGHQTVSAVLNTVKKPAAYIDAAKYDYKANKRNPILGSSIVTPLKKCCKSAVAGNANRNISPEQLRELENKVRGETQKMADEVSFFAKARMASSGKPTAGISLSCVLIILTCIAIFALQEFAHSRPNLQRFVEMVDFSGTAIKDGQLWRLATPAFLHTSLEILSLVMICFAATFIFLEWMQGWRRILLTYFFSIIAGNVVGLYFQPEATMMGASSGVLGLAGATISFVLKYRNTIPYNTWKKMKKYILPGIFVCSLLTLAPPTSIYINLGGFLAGLLMGLAIFRQPARVQPMTVFQWSAMFGLLTATAAFGTHVINFRM